MNVRGFDALDVGDTLKRRLVVAIAERDRQIKAYKLVTSTIEPAVRKEWKGMIDAWLEDTTNPNPYILSRKGTSRSNGTGVGLTQNWRLPDGDRGAIGGQERRGCSYGGRKGAAAWSKRNGVPDGRNSDRRRTVSNVDTIKDDN